MEFTSRGVGLATYQANNITTCHFQEGSQRPPHQTGGASQKNFFVDPIGFTKTSDILIRTTVPPTEGLHKSTLDDSFTDAADRWWMREFEIQGIGETTSPGIVFGEPMFMPPMPEGTADLIIHKRDTRVDLFNAGGPFLPPNRRHWNPQRHDCTVLET
jgi:hypothetical protein